MTSTRREKHKPERIVATLRDVHSRLNAASAFMAILGAWAIAFCMK